MFIRPSLTPSFHTIKRLTVKTVSRIAPFVHRFRTARPGTIYTVGLQDVYTLIKSLRDDLLRLIMFSRLTELIKAYRALFPVTFCFFYEKLDILICFHGKQAEHNICLLNIAR